MQDETIPAPSAQPPAAIATDDAQPIRPRRRSRLVKACAAGAVSALAIGALATGVVVGRPSASERGASQAATASALSQQWSPSHQSATSWQELYEELYREYYGSAPSAGGTLSGGAQQGDGFLATGTTQEAAAEASGDESTGIVLIDTVLGYEDAQAAGTGMVLTSDGLILTNNHVVEGSTEITVTDAATGQTYAASVLGTDATDDVALLQLDDATGLTTVTLDDDDDLAAGDDVTAVGNASGGGVLMAADGSVTQLDSSVTTQAEYSKAGETLDGVIQFSADVVAGDSGGALLDEEGEVVGMTTAASTGAATVTAFAIPIDDALTITEQIESGDESGNVTIGYPAFLGVGVSESRTAVGGWSTQTSTVQGATVQYVYDGTPAADAGLEAGDVITAIDDTAVASASDLTQVLSGYDSGDAISVTWADATGTHEASVTLVDGPVA